jgi:ankyrin repeat protein
MLEYLSTVKSRPFGFDNLAFDFLDICRILWTIEAGLSECSRTHQKFPQDLLQELDKKFRATHSDFQALDQMLTKFLDYEKRGTVGKIQRGWRKIFADNDIEKMTSSLGKNREALRMASVTFEWSLGDTKIDDSVGIGYTGLAAALDRMAKGRSVVGIAKTKTLEKEINASHEADAPVTTIAPTPPPASPLPPLPPLPPVIMPGRDSAKGGLLLNDDTKIFPDLRRNTSMSNQTASSVALRDRTLTASGSFDGLSGSHVHPAANFAASVAGSLERLNLGHPHYTSTSAATTEIETLLHEIDQQSERGPTKVVKLKADPFTMPRWTPRSSAGGNAPPLKAALISAVRSCNHNMIEQLLDRGVSPDTTPDAHIMNEAVLQQDIETIRLLLLFGHNPDLPDRDGVTPLLVAVESSFLEGATMLVKYGADTNLSAGIEPESPLALAVADHKLDFIKLLLTYSGDANHLMMNGNTILIGSITKRTPINIIQLLLDYGSDPNGKNKEGKTPLFEAISCNRVDIVRMLLEKGANPNLPGPKHMLWPSTYYPECLQLLLDKGADYKKTPGIMELASSINNIESVRILLNAGVDPNAKKDGVYTPLCTSIRDNHVDIFHLLVGYSFLTNH